MADKAAKIINGATTVLVGIVIVFALAIVAGKPFGVHAYAVLSGSMEPEYHTGALIYVKEADASKLNVGDVITFMTGRDTTVTHRIVEEVECEDGVTRFRTQGDANSTPDGDLVHPDNVIGTPVLQIPLLGYLVNFVSYPPGTYVAIAAGALIVFLMFLPDLFTKDEDEDGEGEEAPHGSHARAPDASGHARGRDAGSGRSARVAAPVVPASAYPQAVRAYPVSARSAAPHPAATRAASTAPRQARARSAQPQLAHEPRQARPSGNATHAQPRPAQAQAGPSRASGANNPRLARARAQAQPQAASQLRNTSQASRRGASPERRTAQ